MRRVFRDYTVLLVSNRLSLGIYEDMLKPLKFGRIESTPEDQRVVTMARRLKPDLIVASRSLTVFSGAQVLSAIRQHKSFENLPFLLIGDRDDLKPGGLSDQMEKFAPAKLVAMPLSQVAFQDAILDLLDPLIDFSKEDAYRLFDEAEENEKKGQLKDAVECYRQGLAQYGLHVGAWLKLATLNADLEQYEDAEHGFFQALRLDNYSLMAYFGLAELYERRQDYEQTIGVLQQALGVARMLKANSKSVSRINFFIGEFELRLKRLTGAEASFDQAISENPDDAELRSDIGDAYAEKGYYEESEEHYLAALAIDPNLAHVFNRLGIAYRRQNKFDKALKLYEQARLHHPEDENLLFNIARAHWEANNPRDAEIMLEEALLMAPDFRYAGWLVQRLRSQYLNDAGHSREPGWSELPDLDDVMRGGRIGMDV